MRKENKKRAEWAAHILRKFADITNSDLYVDAMTDLVADLRHLCDREELDWGWIDKRAYDHYLAEIEGDE